MLRPQLKDMNGSGFSNKIIGPDGKQTKLQPPMGASPGELRLWRKLNGCLTEDEKKVDALEHNKSKSRANLAGRPREPSRGKRRPSEAQMLYGDPNIAAAAKVQRRDPAERRGSFSSGAGSSRGPSPRLSGAPRASSPARAPARASSPARASPNAAAARPAPAREPARQSRLPPKAPRSSIRPPSAEAPPSDAGGSQQCSWRSGAESEPYDAEMAEEAVGPAAEADTDVPMDYAEAEATHDADGEAEADTEADAPQPQAAPIVAEPQAVPTVAPAPKPSSVIPKEYTKAALAALSLGKKKLLVKWLSEMIEVDELKMMMSPKPAQDGTQ